MDKQEPAKSSREEVYTIGEVQKRFKISQKTITRLIADGTVKAKQVGPGGPGTRQLILADSLWAWLRDPQPYVQPEHRERLGAAHG